MNCKQKKNYLFIFSINVRIIYCKNEESREKRNDQLLKLNEYLELV